MMQATTHYQTLGLEPSASRQEIKSAFRKLSRKLHPDMNPGQDTNAAFAALNEAHRVLCDASARAEYDLTLTADGEGYVLPDPARGARPAYMTATTGAATTFANPTMLTAKQGIIWALILAASITLMAFAPYSDLPLALVIAALIGAATLFGRAWGAAGAAVALLVFFYWFSEWSEPGHSPAYWLHLLAFLGVTLALIELDGARRAWFGPPGLRVGVRDARKFFSWGTPGSGQESSDARSSQATAEDLSSMVSSAVPASRVVHGLYVRGAHLSHLVVTGDRAVAITSVMAPTNSYRWGQWSSVICGNGVEFECLIAEQAAYLESYLGVPVLGLLAVRSFDEANLVLDNSPSPEGAQMVYGREVVGAVTTWLAAGQRAQTVDLGLLNKVFPLAKWTAADVR